MLLNNVQLVSQHKKRRHLSAQMHHNTTQQSTQRFFRKAQRRLFPKISSKRKEAMAGVG
jgi:hypothetical protein